MRTKLFYVVIHHFGWSLRYSPHVDYLRDYLYLVLADDKEDIISKIKDQLPADIHNESHCWEDAWRELCEKGFKHPFTIIFKESVFNNGLKDITTGGLERHNLERGADILEHSLPASKGYEKYQAFLCSP